MAATVAGVTHVGTSQSVAVEPYRADVVGLADVLCQGQNCERDMDVWYVYNQCYKRHTYTIFIVHMMEQGSVIQW